MLLTQFWWVIPLALLGFWLYFVLEIEPQRRRQSAGDGPDGAFIAFDTRGTPGSEAADARSIGDASTVVTAATGPCDRHPRENRGKRHRGGSYGTVARGFRADEEFDGPALQHHTAALP